MKQNGEVRGAEPCPGWAEPGAEQLLQLWRGARAGQGAVLEVSSTDPCPKPSPALTEPPLGTAKCSKISLEPSPLQAEQGCQPLNDRAGSKQKQCGKSLSSAPALSPQLQPLPLEKPLLPSGNIDSPPRNPAIELPAAFPSTSSQLMSGIITKYTHPLKPAHTEMTLGARGGDLQSLLCPSSFHCEELTQELQLTRRSSPWGQL